MNIDLVILAGGKGTRIKKQLNGKSKPIINIKGKPFLDFLLFFVSQFNLNKIYILSGYKGRQIYRRYNEKKINGISIKCLIEKKPLGTGGALGQLKNIIKKKFIVLNGDTIFKINLNNLLNIKLKKNQCFIGLTKSLAKDKNAKLSNLTINKKLVLIKKNANYKNAGIYLLNKSFLNKIKKNKFISLEKIIENEIYSQNVVGKYFKSFFLDIGTPKNLITSRKLLPNLFNKVITNNYF